jgi:oligopeptide transport system permease protein
MFYIAGVLILLVSMMALFPGLFTQTPPNDNCLLANSNAGPSDGHILGFTRQGCDVFSRIVHGTSTSLSVGLIVTVLTLVMGVFFGSLAGFYGKWVDAVLSRMGDIFFAIPYILAAVVIMSVFSAYRNVWVISAAIGIFAWPSTARVLRGEILRVKQADYVMASTAIGVSRFRILIRHVLPNAIAPVIAVTTISLAAAIVAEADRVSGASARAAVEAEEILREAQAKSAELFQQAKDEAARIVAEAELAAEKAKSLLKAELDAIRNRHRDEHGH